MGWRNLTGIASAVSFFFIINIVESMVREKYYYGSMVQGLEKVAAELVLVVLSLIIAIYAWKRNKIIEK